MASAYLLHCDWGGASWNILGLRRPYSEEQSLARDGKSLQDECPLVLIVPESESGSNSIGKTFFLAVGQRRDTITLSFPLFLGLDIRGKGVQQEVSSYGG